MTYGKQIKKKRKALGLTQTELATRANTSQVIISELENDNYCPTISMLNRVAKALRCKLEINFI